MHPAHPDRAFDKRVKHVIEPLLDFYNIFFFIILISKFSSTTAENNVDIKKLA